MLYHRLRKRDFIPRSKTLPSFPCAADVTFELVPPWPFGTKNGDGLSRITSTEPGDDGWCTGGHLHANRHRGTVWAESSDPLQPLNVTVAERNVVTTLTGTTLVMSLGVASLVELEDEIARVYFWFPVFLNLNFGDPPAIVSVTVRTDNGALAIWVPQVAQGRLFFTRQSRQEEYVRDALQRTQKNELIPERRLLAASEYFYTACRLTTLGEMPGEFMAEALLNFAKILEVLFPKKEGVESADAARAGLQALGYASEEIEWHFIPAIYLRNFFGIGHPALAELTPDELQVVHAYTDEAETHYRELLKRIFALSPEERKFLRHESDAGSTRDLRKRIARMSEHQAAKKTETKSVTITNPPPPVAPKSKY